MAREEPELGERRLPHFVKAMVLASGDALTAHRVLVVVMELPKLIRINVDKIERMKWKNIRSAKGNQFIDHIRTYLNQDSDDEEKPTHQK
ncbi:hypothetical protein EVAR_79163_1 [Eumeta japonica]|uniref:Uncharacterized protein n=1 Tax=Eumeta variegata TaxID=151549 RepID=A0A4C1UUY6_EUMVA|nr:hypothetical protein EVAR_79163_1 [Eumeta japonica]